jgi:hypothetical protein
MQLPAGGLFEAVSDTLSRVWQALQKKDQSVGSAKAQAVIKHVSLSPAFPIKCLGYLGTHTEE